VIASRENYNCKNAKPSELQVRCRQAPVKVITKVPPQLHTSREARQEAKRNYQLAFKDKLDGCPVWFNFSIDILYINDSLATKYFFEKFTIRPGQVNKPQWQLGEMRAQLQHVVFADEKVYFHSGDLLRNLKALETAIFPEVALIAMVDIAKAKQSLKPLAKFFYFLRGAPYQHNKASKLKLQLVAKRYIQALKYMVT
jgi:hypothetical protein